jgi:hypothetical protein
MTWGLPDKELGKRLGAGRGYERETTAAFARRIKAGRQEVEQWEKGNFGSDTRPNSTERKREAAVKKVRAASGLPASFFSIDFNDLDAMAAAWRRARPASDASGEPDGENRGPRRELDQDDDVG